MNSSIVDENLVCQEGGDLYILLECDARKSDIGHHNNSLASLLWINNCLANIITPWSCVIGVSVILASIAIIKFKCNGKSTNNYYLIALGVVDMCSLTTILMISPPITGFFGISDLWRQILAPHISTFLQMTIFISNWVTVALALDRHQAICRPFDYYRKSYTLHNKTWVTLSIILICFFLYLPQFFMFSRYYIISDNILGNFTLFTYSNLGLSRIYTCYHLWFVNLILLLLLPTGIILSVNTHLVICVTKSTRILYHSTNLAISCSVKASFSRENIKISLLLFCLIISFFIFQLPLVILIFLTNYRIRLFNSDMTLLYSKIVTFLYVLKHDINFMFYLWLTKRFMRIIQGLVCLKCNNRKPKVSSVKSKLDISKHRTSPA